MTALGTLSCRPRPRRPRPAYAPFATFRQHRERDRSRYSTQRTATRVSSATLQQLVAPSLWHIAPAMVAREPGRHDKGSLTRRRVEHADRAPDADLTGRPP